MHTSLLRKFKFILIGLLIILLKSGSVAQSGYIIIDSLYPGMTKVDLHHARIYCNGDTCGQSYCFDLDNNGVDDMNVRLFGTVSTSNGTSVVLLLSSSDSCTFFNGTGNEYQVITSTKDTTRFLTPVVKILNTSDRLFADSCQANSSKFARKENPPSFHYASFANEWISGTHVFGFKKIKNNKLYLGWVRLQIHDYTHAEFKEYVIQTLPVNINGTTLPATSGIRQCGH